MPRLDPHSWTDSDQPQAEFLTWRAQVDFSTRTLECEALLHFDNASSGPLDLDTRGLTIHRVMDSGGKPLAFDFEAHDPIIGSRLRIDLPSRTDAIKIDYVTSPNASALQWLEPSQTAGGAQPFLYSQCQPIHARSLVPLQDTPRTRLRFSAELRVPAQLTALMAARHLGRELDGAEAVERFEMPQPISPYLLAFAVGDLASRDLSSRSRVWSEPSLVEGAAWEFADTEQMLASGERLFGEYDWERYDLLVLPPSFPFGGMENPRLTFLTPTVVIGDRSATEVIAHELAHSWTGNLISNANAEHFWLNEGWTTYAERRIGELVFGPDVVALAWALGRRELEDAVAQFVKEGKPELSRLRTQLTGVDPDIAYSIVPYEKGALFLWALEESVGRAAFDRFIREYIGRFRFQAVTTEEFVALVDELLPAAATQVNMQRWLLEDGVPEGAPQPQSSRLQAILALGGMPPSDELAATWRPVEWQLFIDSLPATLGADAIAALDARFHFTQARNYDILEKWLPRGIRVGYAPAVSRTEQVLGLVGRMKYLRPLYRALAEGNDTRALASQLFDQFAPRYHPIAREVVRAVLSGG
ncbi:MAG: M1 family metallopeptidase [Chloroflexi bacterium]|nr:M1 family metallopeptidase [Chloroflexota bacterium]